MKRKKVKSLSCVWLFVTPWTGACQAPLSMGFPRQEYWNGLPYPSPGDRPNPGIKHRSPKLRQTPYHLSPKGSEIVTKPWVHLPMLSKVNLLTVGFVKESTALITECPSPGSYCLKGLNSPKGFQGQLFKGTVREGDCGVCDQAMDILLITW